MWKALETGMEHQPFSRAFGEEKSPNLSSSTAAEDLLCYLIGYIAEGERGPAIEIDI